MENSLAQFVFDEHQCMFINFHQYSILQWVSLIFHKSKNYLKIICATMVKLELWIGLSSHNLCMDHSMVQSVFDEHQCMIINFHDYSILQWVSMIFHKRNSY